MLAAVLAIAAHEGAHFAVARALGHRAGRLRLTPLGLRMPISGSLSYRDEALIAAAGPCANLVLLLAALASGRQDFAALNLALAGVNLLPLDGFDGGRLLSALLAALVSPAAAARVGDVLTLCGVGALLAVAATAALVQGSAGVLAFAVAVVVKVVAG